MIDILSKVSLSQTGFGNGIALGVYGDPEQLTRVLNGLFNYGGHSQDEPTFLSETFGYVLTTKPKLRRGLANAFIVANTQSTLDMPRKERKEARRECWGAALRAADDVLARVKCEPFLKAQNEAEKFYAQPYFAGSDEEG